MMWESRKSAEPYPFNFLPKTKKTTRHRQSKNYLEKGSFPPFQKFPIESIFYFLFEFTFIHVGEEFFQTY